MPLHRPARRTFLAGLVASLGAGTMSAFAQSQAPTAGRYGAVQVDVAPLVRIGGGAPAALIVRLLPGKLAGVFADVLERDRQAPVLVVRIDRVYLSAFADAGRPGIASQATDYMDGAGLVVAGGRVDTATPLHVTLPASYSGAYYLPDIDARRLDSLCDQFAYWLRREMRV